MVDLRAIVDTLVEIGFMQVILPFILVYAVTYAILQKSKIFSYDSGSSEPGHVKNVNAIIAFVFGVFVVASITTVNAIESLIVGISLVLIFILVVLILLAFLFGPDYMELFKDQAGKIKGPVAWIIAVVLFLVALGILFSILGVLDWLINWWNDLVSGSGGDFFIWVLIIGFLAFFIYWMGKGDKVNP